jgi:putative hydroxymethylpyrimidine transport system substrate-binding protein
MTTIRRRGGGRALVGALIVAALAATGCSGASNTTTSSPATGAGAGSPGASGAGSSGPPRSVTVLLDWFPNPDHVALYVAQQQGYFTAAGLKVTLQAPSDPTDPPKLVSTGKVELGISYEPEMYFSRINGLDVEAVGALIPTALSSIISVGSSPVKTPADLAGRTVGNSGQATDTAFLTAICAKYKIDYKSLKNVTVKTSLVEAMIAGNVDATIGGYRNIEAVQLAAGGHHPVVFPVTDAGVPDYDELVVIANGHRLGSDPAYQHVVRDFLTALARGARQAQADKAGADAAMKGVAKGYSASELTQMIDATLPLLGGPTGYERMDATAWTSFGDYLHASGLITKPVATSDVMTTDFLPKG